MGEATGVATIQIIMVKKRKKNRKKTRRKAGRQAEKFKKKKTKDPARKNENTNICDETDKRRRDKL